MWGELKQRHGWVPARALVETGAGTAMAQVLFRHKGPVSIGYVPRGPVLAGDAAALWPELLKVIDEMAHRRRAISVIFEPDVPTGLTGTFFDAGVVVGPRHIQPVRTVKIPLGDDETMLMGMHQKTRYNVRLAWRRGVEVRTMPATPENLAAFYGLMLDTSQRNEFGIHSLEYYTGFLEQFGENAVMMGAWSAEGNLAAVVLTACFGAEAIYMYGASSTKYRAHGAAFALQFEAMKWARDRGCRCYDLWGIPPENPERVSDESSGRIAGTKGEDWRGLYRFKIGFGGEIVSYPPTMERRYLPVVPWLARRLNLIQG